MRVEEKRLLSCTTVPVLYIHTIHRMFPQRPSHPTPRAPPCCSALLFSFALPLSSGNYVRISGGLGWTGLDWTGLDWAELSWVGQAAHAYRFDHNHNNQTFFFLFSLLPVLQPAPLSPSLPLLFAALTNKTRGKLDSGEPRSGCMYECMQVLYVSLYVCFCVCQGVSRCV